MQLEAQGQSKMQTLPLEEVINEPPIQQRTSSIPSFINLYGTSKQRKVYYDGRAESKWHQFP